MKKNDVSAKAKTNSGDATFTGEGRKERRNERKKHVWKHVLATALPDIRAM